MMIPVIVASRGFEKIRKPVLSIVENAMKGTFQQALEKIRAKLQKRRPPPSDQQTMAILTNDSPSTVDNPYANNFVEEEDDEEDIE